MADKSLKDLSNSLQRIAENSPKIQKDVEDIRKTVCGPDGIVNMLSYITESVSNIEKQKKVSVKDVTGLDTKKMSKSYNKIISNTDGISKTLKDIFDQLKTNLSKGGDDLKKKLQDFIDKLKSKEKTSNKPSVLSGYLEKIISYLKKISGKSSGGSTKLSGSNFKMDRRNMDFTRKDSKIDGISKSLDIVSKLKDIKMKDFIFAKTKLKHIGNIMKKSLGMFKMFKDSKEVDETINFVSSSVDLIKKLAKISILSKPAQWGARAIEIIFFGKKGDGGLLKVFKKLHKHKKEVEYGKKGSSNIAKTCGSLFIASLCLAGIAAIGPVTLLGALLASGIILILVGTFKLLSKSLGALTKGSIAFAVLSVGLLAFGVGFGILRKSTEGLKLADVGIMLASIVGTGLAVAGIGLLSIPIVLGSGSIILIGAALGILGLALRAWTNFDSKPAMNNIKTAIDGLRESFGIELGKHDENASFGSRLGNGIMDMAMGLLNFGKTFFTMGSILLAGASLGFLAFALKPWDNYDATKAIGNIKSAVSGLKEAFGLDDRKDESLTSKFTGMIGDTMGFASSLMQMGSTFATMASLVVATISMDIIRLALMPWEKYDGTKAIGNIKSAVSGLKEAFGLDDRSQEGLGGKFGGMFSDTMGFASSLLQMGSTFVTMGTLVMATVSMDIIKKALEPWDKYDAKKAIQHIKSAVYELKKVFGLNEREEQEKKEGGGFLSGLKNIASDLFQTASNIAAIGPMFTDLSHLIIATASMDTIRKSLQPWDKYDSKKSITHVKEAMSSLKLLLMNEKATISKDDAEYFKKTTKFFKDGMENLDKGLKNADRISNGIITINDSLKHWTRRSYAHSVVMSKAINKLRWSFNKLDGKDLENKSETLMDLFETLHDNKIKEKYSSIPIAGSVNAINALDITKGRLMMDLFKSFDKIKSQKPFDRFNNAVDKFVDGCMYIIDSINGITNPEVRPENQNNNNNVSQPEPTYQRSNVSSSDTKQLADAIAKALRTLPVRISPNMLDINLVVDGVSGKTVKLTLQD